MYGSTVITGYALYAVAVGLTGSTVYGIYCCTLGLRGVVQTTVADTAVGPGAGYKQDTNSMTS